MSLVAILRLARLAIGRTAGIHVDAVSGLVSAGAFCPSGAGPAFCAGVASLAGRGLAFGCAAIAAVVAGAILPAVRSGALA